MEGQEKEEKYLNEEEMIENEGLKQGNLRYKKLELLVAGTGE